MPHSINMLAVSLPNWVSDYLTWWIAGAIVVVGMAVFGANEVARLRFRRVWAISSVGFAESIRRKVLWVTPLVILGVIAISLLQHPVDQQEAIRQTIKFCLFASGLLVTVTAIILACTNLPREIENRIIYTIVTKPTTRLEIVLGKTLGFVRISGVIILIMGVFSFCYLEWENWRLTGQVTERLRTETDASSQQTLRGYETAGLLNTKSLVAPIDFQIYEHTPSPDGRQLITGGQGFDFLVPFELTANDAALLAPAAESPPRTQALVINTMRLIRNEPTKEDLSLIQGQKLPMQEIGTDQNVLGPDLPGHERKLKPIPQLSIEIVDENQNVLVSSRQINGGKPASAPVNRPPNADGTYSIAIPLDGQDVSKMLESRRFFIKVLPATPSVEYEVDRMPTVIDVPRKGADGNWVDQVIKPAPDPNQLDGVALPRFITTMHRYGMQVLGSPDGKGSVAVFRFRNAAVPKDSGGTVSFRFRGGIERGGDLNPGEQYSVVTLTVINHKTKQSSGPIEFHPETNRDISIAVPASAVAGGDFDALIRGMEKGQWVGMTPTSVQFISAEHNFAWNLAKSLFILWLFSVLVVIVSIFTSTFLSWPIAVVLTLFILLGHWGVEQLGDALTPGLVGHAVATDLGFRDPAQLKVVSASVNALTRLLTTISAILPDLSKFPVMDDITRGVSIPNLHIVESLGVLVCYGLPMLVLSFVILKNKEVAP
jgi:hypothetical protein